MAGFLVFGELKVGGKLDLTVFVPPPSQPRGGSTAPTVDRVRPPESGRPPDHLTWLRNSTDLTSNQRSEDGPSAV
mgnify:FL=1